MSNVKFNTSQNVFFQTLRKKVDHYFANNELHPSGNRKLYFKGIIQTLSAACLYTILVFFTPNIFISVILCALLGINFALIGFNVMHEGGHQSFSKSKFINKISGYSLNVLGANIYFWKIKHNINHHTYTNIEGLDSDIDVRPFMRLHEEQPRYWFHKFQHIYWFILYGVSYLAWVFYDDFYKYFSGKIAGSPTGSKFDAKQHFIFWITKISYVLACIVVPIFMVGALKALVGYAILSVVCGLTTSIVFQLAHVVEATNFPKPTGDANRIEQEWAVHQIATTANFATKSKFLYWLLGGLNFQVEHHLFPRISHIHYPKINQLVKDTCKEFSIAYNEYPSMFKAFYSHLLHIKKLGKA